MNTRRRLAVVGLAAAALVLAPAAAASAHPLGNFTVSQYHGLRVTPDHVEDTAVLDSAEIPTLQQRADVDSDHDGSVSGTERSRYAAQQCQDLARDTHARVDGTDLRFAVTRSALEFPPGAAGLATSRLTCHLRAPVDLSRAATLRFGMDHLKDRVGWREIVAVGTGVSLPRSPVPTTSVSDSLRNYPDDLLSSPLDVRSATLRVTPGSGASSVAGAPSLPSAGPLDRVVGKVNAVFTDLVGQRHTTLTVGLLAVLLALVLGASHAALPGHGKTVMAAYIAGRDGTPRDAFLVGATVTATHTGGVLTLGLLLTTSARFAGDTLLGYLGLASGLLIAGIGARLLYTAVRHRRRDRAHAHAHAHGHAHSHDHGHSHGRVGRSGLVGMGVAGGLVPSPSALVVLLGAVALGRTWFGVLLVVAYGLGMALTLTAAGLLLVYVRGRLRLLGGGSRLGRLAGRLNAATPVGTAGLVVVVGLGLTARALV